LSFGPQAFKAGLRTALTSMLSTANAQRCG